MRCGAATGSWGVGRGRRGLRAAPCQGSVFLSYTDTHVCRLTFVNWGVTRCNPRLYALPCTRTAFHPPEPGVCLTRLRPGTSGPIPLQYPHSSQTSLRRPDPRTPTPAPGTRLYRRKSEDLLQFELMEEACVWAVALSRPRAGERWPAGRASGRARGPSREGRSRRVASSPRRSRSRRRRRRAW